MARFIIRAKYTNEGFKGMMADPQNREPAIRKLFESVGATVNEVLYSVSRGEIIVDVEGDTAAVGRAGMITRSSDAISDYEVSEVISPKAMATMMRDASDASRQFSAPNQVRSTVCSSTNDDRQHIKRPVQRHPDGLWVTAPGGMMTAIVI